MIHIHTIKSSSSLNFKPSYLLFWLPNLHKIFRICFWDHFSGFENVLRLHAVFKNHSRCTPLMMIGFSRPQSWSVFSKGICARNIFKSWKMVPKANPENFVKIWSPEEEIWGFKDVRRCRFYFMDVNHSSSKRATNDSHKEHVHTLTLILMALVRPKVNSNGIKSIFRYFCMILFLH